MVQIISSLLLMIQDTLLSQCYFVMWSQVLEPSLAKGNRVMVFCNTLNSSRAVDHFLSENQISTVNYHGEVPAEQR